MEKAQKEAQTHMKEGDEALKTGLFKWNKDYASAAISYDEAGKIYRKIKDYEGAMKAYEKVIAVNEKLNDPWAIARNYESILTLNLERQDGRTLKPDVLVDKTIKAGYYFRLAESYSTYIGLTKKVAKYLKDNTYFNDAVNLFKNLLNELEDSEQHYLRSEVVSDYVGLLLLTQKFPEAISIMEREYVSRKQTQSKTIDGVCFSIILLYIINENLELAEKRMNDFALELNSFAGSHEFDACDKLINAYNAGDQTKFNEQTVRTVMTTVFPVEIVKCLRKVVCKANPEKKPQNLQELLGTNDQNGEVNEDEKKKVLDKMFC